MLAKDLGEAVNRTIQRGGRVLVPAFSLGRTQTIIFYLHQLIETGVLKPLPIFVDSPLAAKATEVFQMHPECFDEETTQILSNTRLFANARAYLASRRASQSPVNEPASSSSQRQMRGGVFCII